MTKKTFGIPYARESFEDGCVFATCPECGERIKLVDPKDEDSYSKLPYAEHYAKEHS